MSRTSRSRRPTSEAPIERRFIDRSGVEWTVREAITAPLIPERRERRDEPRSGKRDARAERFATRPLDLPRLCFESVHGRRYLDAFPPQWHALPEHELEDLLGAS